MSLSIFYPFLICCYSFLAQTGMTVILFQDVDWTYRTLNSRPFTSIYTDYKSFAKWLLKSLLSTWSTTFSVTPRCFLVNLIWTLTLFHSIMQWCLLSCHFISGPLEACILRVDLHFLLFAGEQGWRSGNTTSLPLVWPGFKSRRRRSTWIEFVVGSLLSCERFFSRYSGFPLSSKTNTSKFEFDLGRFVHG